MIVVSGEIVVDPELHDALLELAGAVEPPSRAEPGCEAYGFWTHPTERGVVHVFEVWRDTDAIDAHGATDHFRTFARGLRALAPVRVDVSQYEASIRG